MNKRDTTTHLLDGALLEPIAENGPIRLRRYLPSPSVAAFVRHFWFVTWDFPAGQSYLQPVLPLPAVNAVIEQDGAWVYGVWSRRYDKVLAGRGNAWGVLFLPTGLASFWKRSIHDLQDRRVPFAEIFDLGVSPSTVDVDPAPATSGLIDSFDAIPSDVVAVSLLEGYLSARVSKEPPCREVQAWVASIEHDPTLIRVEQLAQLHGVSVRTLQRAMRHYVGLGPKHLIRRYRLLEAASRLASGKPCNQADLALELGYSDQAHFARDFRSVVGTSPGRQSRQERPRVPHPPPAILR